MLDFTVNQVAIVVAALSNMIVGALWYSPLLFGKEWMKLAKMTKKDSSMSGSDAVKTYLFYFLSSYVMAYVLAYLLAVMPGDMRAALLLAFWLWVGFILTGSLSGVLWAKKPFDLFAIVSAQRLVSLLVMAAVLVSM